MSLKWERRSPWMCPLVSLSTRRFGSLSTRRFGSLSKRRFGSLSTRRFASLSTRRLVSRSTRSPREAEHVSRREPAHVSAPEPEPVGEVGMLEQAPPPPMPPIRSGATPDSVLATLRSGWPAELVQVETDPGKVLPIPELEDMLGLRAGRTRPTLPPISDEPLVQVETRKREWSPDDNPRTAESSPA